MTLEEIRTEIDRIDSKMKDLFAERMECAGHVAKVKAVSGKDVYVPEREQAVIGRRSSEIAAEIREEYIAFQRHLMSVCRRYEYGLLDRMQEQVTADALNEAGFSAEQEHSRVRIRFSCPYEESNLNLFINMAALNHIGICGLDLKLQDGRQEIDMTLEGKVNDGNMKCLLCQIGKESEGFQIAELY